MFKLLKPNLDKIGITIFLFFLTSLFFALLTQPETVQPTWLLVLVPSYVVSSLLFQTLYKYRLGLWIFRWIVFTPLSILAALSLISQFAPNKPPKDFVITHNFVDLSQVFSLSKYRSCRGHQTVEQYSDEPISNMQHYVGTDPRVDTGQVKIYAPFNGYVLGDAPFTLADGLTMIPKSGIPWWPFNQWRFSMSQGAHVLPQFQDPPIHEVKAGDLIGYLDSLDRYGNRNTGTHLRLGVTAIPPMFKNGNGEPYKKLDSVFRYMSDEVFAEYQAVIPGLTSKEDFIISRAWRGDHPCQFQGKGPNFVINRVEDLPLEEQDIYIGVGIKDVSGMQKKRMCDDPEDIANNRGCL